MGIQDRDYYRSSPTTARQILSWTQTAVGLLIVVNAIVFLVQLIGQPGATAFLSAEPDLVFRGQVWKLLTANFAHSPHNLWHIIGNMMFLWVLGRELEHIYGRKDFLILYLSAGVLAILAEATWDYFSGNKFVQILGASGAVMAVVTLCALFYPRKTIRLMFLPPAPLWLFCVLYIAMDLVGTLKGPGGVANVAHLAGAAVGFLYWFFDLRTSRFGARFRFRRRTAARRPSATIIARPQAFRRASGPREREEQAVYARVDQLLAKIHASGMDSLSGEELDFLRTNAGRFRREDDAP